MTRFKTYRVAVVALLSTVVVGAMSFLPGALSSQIAGAVTPYALVLNAGSPNPAAFGAPVTFSATLSGGTSLLGTGDIAFGAYTQSNCGDPGGAVFTVDLSPGLVSANGPYSQTVIPTTPGLVPAPPGTYYGDAYFNGDSNNLPASSGCVPLVVISPALAVTSLTLLASPNPAASGAPVTFTATLSGGSSPTGTISLAAYLNSPNCSLSTPTFSQDVSVSGNGPYDYAPVTPAPGSYYGEAYYTGDGSNTPASSGSCDLILVVNQPNNNNNNGDHHHHHHHHHHNGDNNTRDYCIHNEGRHDNHACSIEA